MRLLDQNMNTESKIIQLQRDSDPLWQTFVLTKSELAVLLDEVEVIKLQLETKMNKARAKLKLLSALRETIVASAEDEVPNEISIDSSSLSSTARKSAAHNVIRRLILDKKVSVIETSDLIKTTDIQSIGIPPKTIYNALNYLAARGELERVGRGRYRIKELGLGVESSNDMEQLEDFAHE
jgi:Transcriptional regulator, AbiEi antitoxin